MPDKRRFTIKSTEAKLPQGYSGHFESNSPWAAARKATRAIYRESKTTKKEIRFVLRETTQGSAHKEYHYIGVKRKLEKPVDTGRVNAKGEPIIAKFEYHAKACR